MKSSRIRLVLFLGLATSMTSFANTTEGQMSYGYETAHMNVDVDSGDHEGYDPMSINCLKAVKVQRSPADTEGRTETLLEALRDNSRGY